MRTLLRIDASSQIEQSHSRGLADYYEARWKSLHPKGKVITRDLTRNPLPHLDEATIAIFYAGGEPMKGKIPAGIALSNQLISELKSADDVVVSSAVYNFGMPSALKAWIDHIVRFGSTITLGERGPVGLLENKRACFLTARGGTPERSPDFQYPVLQAVFAYIGIQTINWVSLEGTRMPDSGLDSRISKAEAAIDNLFKGENLASCE
ncbi:MAG: FMN-dependent NADH-azoreductase [Verrucomicrobiales bacterium]